MKMRYYSTNKESPSVTLKDAIIRGIATDRGVYMPEKLPIIPMAFFNNISGMSLQEVSYVVANILFGDDIESEVLKDIVFDTLNFDIPLVNMAGNRYVMELFHGPTSTFKDVGARFMARILAYFNKNLNDRRPINVLLATTGDAGNAVASGFADIQGVRAFILYPKGNPLSLQRNASNIFPIEVDGTFEDCQSLIEQAIFDEELNNRLKMTNANSINIARLLPQIFYYFHAYAQLAKIGDCDMNNVVISIPNGSVSTVVAGLLSKEIGLPVKRFIVANKPCDMGLNSISGKFGYSVSLIKKYMEFTIYDDAKIIDTQRYVLSTNNYRLAESSAMAYKALYDNLEQGETGVALATNKPTDDISRKIPIPQDDRFTNDNPLKIENSYNELKDLITSL